MKQLATLTGLLMSMAVTSAAQTALPYNTGFDNASQKAGWQEFRKGLTTSPHFNFEEDFATYYTPASNPNCLIHMYPSGTTATQDWYVSPGLNLTSGAKVQLKINVYAFAGREPGDTVQLYLLKGNADPALATAKTKLADFSYMTTTATTYLYKDTAGIVVPATTGNAYLAIRYTSLSNWFTIAVDDIKVTANPTSAIEDQHGENTGLVVYPNPAKDLLRWNYTATPLTDKMEASLVDMAGRTINSVPLKNKQLNISTLQPGTYILKSGAGAIPFTKD